MLNAEIGNVQIIRDEGEQVRISLKDLGWEFQTLTLIEAELIGRALIAAAEEEE